MALLDGKVAIITGASSGIGRAAASLFAAEGAAVVAVARRGDALQDLVREIERQGGRAVAVVGSVTEEATHRAAVDAAVSRFGGLDVAFNNAGAVGTMAPLAMLQASQWSEVVALNLTAAFLGARAQIPAMLERQGGALVFTGTFVGNSVGIPGMGAYATAKAGLIGLVRSITADYGAAGIRANVLQAGGTATEAAGDDAQREWAATLHAMKRLAAPEEIARAALFLASDMASFVAGSALWVDGGNAAVKL